MCWHSPMTRRENFLIDRRESRFVALLRPDDYRHRVFQKLC